MIEPEYRRFVRPMAFPDSDSYTPPVDPPAGQFIVAITKANPGVISVDAAVVLDFVVGSTVYVSGVGGMSELNGRLLTVDSIVTGATHEIVLSDGGTPVDTTAYGTYTGGGTLTKASGSGAVSTTGIATCSNNLYDDGAYNTITWSAVPGAHRYQVYKLFNGLWGYIGQTSSLSFVDDNIGPMIDRTPPIYDDPFSGEGRYPGAAGYFEQRRCFAGADADPAYFWATRSGTESNLSYSTPGRDDDSIRFRIAARERCAIRHIVPMTNLILLTESSEWRVAPADGEVLTPDVSVRPQSYVGAGFAQPVIVNNNLLFSAARGGHVRELAYNSEARGYLNGDICLRAPHLFDGLSIVEMAYAKAPFPIVWCVSSSGDLLGNTYVPEQDIGPWHRHDTQDGVFESICVIPEGDADVLYAVVRRTTANGEERFIERMEPRQATDGAGGFFVDSGLSYEGEPETVFTGLDHLEGQEVTILADGGVLPPQVVTDGAVTLDEPASLVHVGLPIEADLQGLPLAFEVQGFGQGRPKNISDVWLRLYASRGVHVGPSFDRLTELKPQTAPTGGTAPDLITGEVKVSVQPAWGTDGSWCLRHRDPLPFTLVSMTVGFAVGG